MGMSAGKGSAKAVPYINVTPMIDVLLVILIIFMTQAPLKPSRFKALVPEEPDKNQQIDVKPNPLTLVITVASDFKLKLNQDDIGSVDDTGALSAKLTQLFAQRKETGGFKTGTQEVERTVFIKAPRSLKYGNVVKVIDAAKAAGATPVGLQIDDLAQ